MPTTIHSGPMTRDATPAELTIYKRYIAAVDKGRTHIQALVAAGACLSYAEEWRRANAPSLAPVFTDDDTAQIQELCKYWNQGEEVRYSLETGKFAFRVNAQGTDIDIYDIPGERTDVPVPVADLGELGLIPLVLVIVGVALIVGAIVATTVLDNQVTKKELELRARLADLDAKMAAAPADVRAAYKTLKETEPFKGEKSTWDKMSGAITDVLSGALPLVLAILLIPLLTQSARESSRAPAPRENPCGGGPPGYIWPAGKGGRLGGVVWSHDPTKRKRQARHIQDFYDRAEEREQWAYYKAQGDVPF